MNCKWLKTILYGSGKKKETKSTLNDAFDEAAKKIEKIQEMVADTGMVDSVDDDAETHEWKPIVSIDFDGVIHSYTSGWKGAGNIPDPPVSIKVRRQKKRYTSIDWLTELVRDGNLDVNIFSSRNAQSGGIEAMRMYLLEHGMSLKTLRQIKFPKKKPPSHLLIDDRAVQFKGEFLDAGYILNFVPYKFRNHESKL